MAVVFVGADVNTPQLDLVCWLAVPTASVAFTITKTTMFGWLRKRFNPDGWIYDLLTCPYCMCHWVAGFFVAIFRPQPTDSGSFDLVFSLFAIVTMAALIIQLMMLTAKAITLLTDLSNKLWES